MRASLFLLSIAVALATRDENLPDGGVRKTLTELQIHITVSGFVHCRTDNTTFHIALMEHDDLSNDLIAETQTEIYHMFNSDRFRLEGWAIDSSFEKTVEPFLVVRHNCPDSDKNPTGIFCVALEPTSTAKSYSNVRLNYPEGTKNSLETNYERTNCNRFGKFSV